MSDTVIAKRYARALAELGREHGQVQEFGLELERLVEAFTVEPRLGLLLTSPSLDEEKKIAIISGLADYLQLSAMLRNFCGLLLSRNRLQLLPVIAEVYKGLADAVMGIQRAQVTSVVPLESYQREELRQALSERCEANVVLEEKIEPELLGGIRVQLGNRVLDGSVRTQLRRLAGNINRG
ncbi:MAG: ATP synthase F1 subunit delta [Syntrophotaleaceae bacterium]